MAGMADVLMQIDGRPASAAAADLLAVLDGLSPETSGGFWAYDGNALPW